MMALLLAAHMAAAPAPTATLAKPYVQTGTLNPVPLACRGGVTEAASQGQARLWRLGELPKPHMEIAVNRTIGGCSAPIIVRYDAQMDDRPAAPTGG